MKYDVLYNHISPITGSIKLLKGHIAIGDIKGISYSSPIFEYLKNDFLNLRKKIDELIYLDYGAINVGNKYGIASPIKLGAAVFPLPDVSSIGLSFINNIPIPNPTFNPLSPMDWLMSGPWLPQVFAGSVNTDLSDPKTVVSSSLAMNQIRTAKNFKLFDNANFIVANKNVSFLWDNPSYLLANLDPKLASILSLYDLGTSYTFTEAQSLGDLESGLLKNKVDNGTGTLLKAVAGVDYIDLGIATENMQLALIRPEKIENDVDVNKIISRKNIDEIIPKIDGTYITRIKNDKLPNSIALKDLVGLLHPNGGLLKIDINGTPIIAKGGSSVLLGDDYLTPANYLTLDERIDALAEGLATAIEFQFAADVVFTITQLLGFASQVASNYRLNELRDQTIILKKAGDNKNTFKTRYNIIFDNNETGGVNTNWEYGVSLLAEDSSLTETFGNNIHPIFFRIGGKSNFITYDQTAEFFALKVDFVNDGTKVNKWKPKKLTLCLGKQDYVREDRSGYDTTKGEILDDILEYDRFNKKIIFNKDVSFNKNMIIPVVESTNIPLDSEIGSMFFCSDL
jgi:hypothetical protein